ncbi:MAG TPA: LTA synthase family protein [Nocardioidaceae bacterium]|nr:LTA synthase family protein [Nocardioidaceae bacterium]
MSTNDPPADDSAPETVDAAEGSAAPSAEPSPRTFHALPRLARSAAIFLLFGVVIAVLAETVLEAARTGWNWPYVAELASRDLGVLAMSAAVLLLILLSLLAVTGSMWISGALVLGTATVLGIASYLKFVARREPIYPRDLAFMAEPEFLMEMVEPRLLWLTVLGLVGLVAFTWALSKLFTLWLRRRPVTEKPRRWRTAVIASRVAVVGACALLLSSLLHFNHADNTWRRAFESAGARWAKASQPTNYKINGFVGGFLYNLDIPAMAKPRGYSRAAMERIVAEYAALAKSDHDSRNPAALDDVNIISVLAESFSDPTRFEGVELAEDPIARTREFMSKVPHGLMLTQKIGGGTSSMEFETLTGMSLSQFNSAMDTPYQMLLPKYRHFPSAVEVFNQLGHRTLAIHPYKPTMYQRDHVYPILGFDDFIARSEMDHRGRPENNRFISDHAAFRQALDAIQTYDESVFINLVTMQNHTPYTGKYSDPIEVEGLTDDGAEMVGQYSRGLSLTDRAIGRFIRAVDRSEEKTVVLLYGDHLPAGLPESVFENNSDRALHETPFFIYSNFGKPEAEELPTTSPIFFLPRVFDMLGAPLSPYYALLRELERHVSAMEHGLMISPDGYEISPARLSPKAREVLRDYRLVQYDLSVGRRYAETMMYPRPASTVAASRPSE